jgi:hypothetical protein
MTRLATKPATGHDRDSGARADLTSENGAATPV